MREYMLILRTLNGCAQALRDSLRYAVARFQYRDFDRALKCEQVGPAVTLDHDAVQSDHGGAIVSPRVHSSPQCAQAGTCRERPQFAKRNVREFLARRIRKQAGP